MLLLLLVIDFGNCLKDGSDQGSGETTKVKKTRKPISNSDDSMIDDVAIREADKGSSASGSDDSLGEIDGHKIIKCNGTQELSFEAGEMKSFYRESTPSVDPYTCALTVPTKNSLKDALLSIDKCEEELCNKHKISCTEIELTNGEEGFNYGTFSVMLKPGNVPNTITKVSLVQKEGSNGQMVSDVYIAIYGNQTEIRYGYHYDGYENANTKFKSSRVSSQLFQSFTNVTIKFTKEHLSFYAAGQTIGHIASMWNKEKVASPPVYFRVTYLQNSEVGSNAIKASLLPASAYVKDFNFVAGPCTDSDEELTNWGSPKAYLDYYTSNCTLFRPHFIFNNTMDPDWELKAIGDPRMQSLQFPHIGDNIEFGFNSGKNTLRFVTTKPFPIYRHKYFIFWINGGDRGGQNLWIAATHKNHIVAKLNVNDYVIGGIQKNQWYKVIIGMNKFQTQTSSPKKKVFIDGIMFQPTYDGFMDMTYFDDIMFSNGSICMEAGNSLSIYGKGNFSEGMEYDKSIGNYDTKSTVNQYKKKNTIEYQIVKKTVLQVNFMNGSISITDYDGLQFTVQYIPNNGYISGGTANDNQKVENVVNSLRLQLCLMQEDGIATYPCLSLSSYVGGRFPANRWFTLNIPWNDLSVDFEGATFGGFLIKSPDDMDPDIYQGKLYISQIAATHYKPPPVEHLLEGSFSFKLSWNFNLTLLSIISIVLLLF
ncbi:hypothetical protein RB653_004071 [Dictyostelium firmibasis]|uniref:Uncharacterized protein n=1 Tax=Dictyostelium firmibasis TaxID=79012 RepID=A0AAN7YXP1_9MYCE